MEFSRDRNSVSSLQAHLVFVTKYRRKILNQESFRLVEESCQSVAKKMDFEVLEFNGETDHIHLLIAYPPKWSISQIVNALKGVSSRKYGQAKLPKPYGKAALWSPSYFVSSVGGAPLKVLVAYIQNQEKPP